jgi:hypothetical protein
MASGASATCDFQVTVDSSTALEIVSDDMESGTGWWTVSHGTGSDDWTLNTDNPHTPSNAWFAEDITTSTDQYLTLANPVPINGDALLRFWHDYDTEAAWDGGVVEISANGGAWTDLGNMMVYNGYNGLINTNPASAISGRWAFTGDSLGYVETLVDLSSYAGNTARIRFRMATDGFVGGVGWYVDDVEMLDDALLYNEACVTAAEGDSDCDGINTAITPVVGPPVPKIVVSPESLSASQDVDQTSSQALSIGNSGGADLTWSIGEDSNGDCSTSEILPWASASPTGGTVSPSGSTNVDVTFDATGQLPGLYTGALCVNSNDSDDTPVTVDLTLAVNDPSSTQERLATGEIPGTGAVVGSYTDTQADDGFSETITEQHQGGKPANRFDGLEHIWTFQLQSGTGLTVNANAWATDPGNDGDEIQWFYSSDNTNYIWFYTLSSSASANNIIVPLPDQSAGPFYVKAMDADRTSGNNNNASFNVDYLSITEGGTPMPPSSIVMTVSDLADESELSNRRNRWNAIVRATVIEKDTVNPVEGAVVSGSFSNGASGGGSCTTNSSGQCTIKKPNIKLNVPTVTFSVNDVARGMDTYEASSITSIVLQP